MPKFPKMIYVRWEEARAGEEPFLTAGTDIEESENNEKVAIYQLVEVKVKRVTHELV